MKTNDESCSDIPLIHGKLQEWQMGELLPLINAGRFVFITASPWFHSVSCILSFGACHSSSMAAT
jgi:hypothetical protein